MPLLHALLIHKKYVQYTSWNFQVSHKGKQSSEHVCLERKLKKNLIKRLLKLKYLYFLTLERRYVILFFFPRYGHWLLHLPLVNLRFLPVGMYSWTHFGTRLSFIHRNNVSICICIPYFVSFSLEWTTYKSH